VNFDFTISAPFLVVIATQIGGALWAWFSVKTKADQALINADEAAKRANEAASRVSALELQLIREYTSLQHMQNVENRLGLQINELTSEIRELRRFLMDKKS